MPKQTIPGPGSHPGRVIDIDVKSEMEGSFLEYAYSVIIMTKTDVYSGCCTLKK